MIEVEDPLTNSLMGSFLIEVSVIIFNHACQMPSMKDKSVVQTFSAQAAQEPFTNVMSPRSSIGCLPVFLFLSLRPHKKRASPIGCHDREGDIGDLDPRVLLRVTVVPSIHRLGNG